jgi:hypothetical protein
MLAAFVTFASRRTIHDAVLSDRSFQASGTRYSELASEYRVNVGPVRVAAETQLRNGGNSGTGNAFQGSVGFDCMGVSFDVLGSEVNDAVSAAPLSAAQVVAAVTTPVPIGLGAVAATVSGNTAFMLVAKDIIGPVELYGGFEHINFANPNNPLAPGAFIEGGYTVFTPNNTT